MDLHIAVLAGDGVGPEVTREAERVVRVVAGRFDHALRLESVLGGAASLETLGTPLSEGALAACAAADAILFGAVGGPQYDGVDPALRPEQMLLRLRKTFALYANVRPVHVYSALRDAGPLKASVVDGVDVVVVRELTGGLYYGRPSGRSVEDGVRRAVDTLPYGEDEIARIARTAFEIADARPRKRVTSVDKANVLQTSRLWREVVSEVAAEFPAIELRHLLVDNAAMTLVSDPRSLDVVVTENMFGDILSDEAAVLASSIGLLPSASLGARRNRHGLPFGLYEPIHGSAPDIAGKGIANPIGTIASVAMMFRHSFGLTAEAEAVEAAIERTLDSGLRTADLETGGVVTTRGLGDAIVAFLT